jgi:pSer/pThr/pTyr-binding forkhead associated (FHA) protein
MTDSPSTARLTIKTGPDSGKEIELTQKELVIGRLAPAGLVINHPEISRLQARLTCREGNYVLEDLGSRNGTFLNGQPVHTPQVLADGAEIQFGTEVRLVFHQPQTATQFSPGVQQAPQTVMEKSQPIKAIPYGQTMLESDITADAVKASVTGPPPELCVTIAGQDTKTYMLTKERITLGRADDNDIVVASQIMSRHHATFEKTPSGYDIVIAQGVINTLTVQGCPVTERQALSHADVLRIDSELPGMMVSMTYQAPSQATA